MKYKQHVGFSFSLFLLPYSCVEFVIGLFLLTFLILASQNLTFFVQFLSFHSFILLLLHSLLFFSEHMMELEVQSSCTRVVFSPSRKLGLPQVKVHCDLLYGPRINNFRAIFAQKILIYPGDVTGVVTLADLTQLMASLEFVLFNFADKENFRPLPDCLRDLTGPPPTVPEAEAEQPEATEEAAHEAPPADSDVTPQPSPRSPFVRHYQFVPEDSQNSRDARRAGPVVPHSPHSRLRIWHRFSGTSSSPSASPVLLKGRSASVSGAPSSVSPHVTRSFPWHSTDGATTGRRRRAGVHTLAAATGQLNRSYQLLYLETGKVSLMLTDAHSTVCLVTLPDGARVSRDTLIRENAHALACVNTGAIEVRCFMRRTTTGFSKENMENLFARDEQSR